MSLVFQSLRCRRGNRWLSPAITGTLAAGEILLLRGVNGCGKSSLLRVLAGLWPAAEGKLEWQGQAVACNLSAYQQNLHYLGHRDALQPELAVSEMLAYWAALQGVSFNPDDEKNILSPLALSQLAPQKISQLSAGQKRRLALSRLFLSPRTLWLLDEPQNALDASSQSLLQQMMLQHTQQGGMIIAALHGDLILPKAQTLNLVAT